MVRTQIYLTEEERKSLKSLALSKGLSQSDLIRKAIDDLITRSVKIDKGPILEKIAGIWATREDVPDYRDLRRTWRRRDPK